LFAFIDSGLCNEQFFREKILQFGLVKFTRSVSTSGRSILMSERCFLKFYSFSEHALPKQKLHHQEKKFDSLLKLLFNIPFSKICNSSTFTLIFSTFLITIFCLSIIPYIQYRLSFPPISNMSNITLTEKLNSTFHRLRQCRKFDNYVWQNFVSLPLAIVVTLICSCLKRRDTFCLQFCYGRPSLPMPFNLFDKRQRHIIAAIFGISANEVLKILEEILMRLNTKSVTDDDGIIVELLKKIGIVLLIGMRYFPLLIR
jgi:hypothetical protein